MYVCGQMERRMKLIPEEYFKVENTRPMDNRYYLVPKLHQAFHHYIKVRTICARTPLCVYVYSAFASTARSVVCCKVHVLLLI
jgi:hypothetical protein